MNFLRLSPAFFLFSLILGSSGAAEAGTVDYSSFSSGDYSSPIDSGGVTATTAGTFGIEQGAGLGVLIFSFSVDPLISDVNSATFTFDAGGASSVSFATQAVTVGSNESDDNFKLTGYAIGGASLGTVEVNLFATLPNYAVSSLFGNVELSGFTIAGDGPGDGGLDVESITFTAVPEPSTLLPTGLGLIALVGFAVRCIPS